MQIDPHFKRAVGWAAAFLALGGALWLLGPVLTPFLVAAVLAYMVNPVVNRLDRALGGRFPRVLAVVLVEVFFFVAALGFLLLVVPVLVRQIPLMREQVPLLLEHLVTAIRPWLLQFGLDPLAGFADLRAFVVDFLGNRSEDLVASALASLRVGGSVLLTIIGNAVLIPVVLFYLLTDWARIVAGVWSLVPRALRGALESFVDEADEVLGQYLRGQALVMLALAVYYSAGLAAFGLNVALPIGVFTGLAVFVPYIGFGVGLVLALLSGMLQMGLAPTLVMVGVVYGAGQVIESFFLTPRLVGSRVGLHPLAVIFALMAFGQLFGFLGVLVALPASAVLLVALRRLKRRYLADATGEGTHARVPTEEV